MTHFLLIDIDPEHIPSIADRIEDLCQRAGMNVDDSFRFKICVTEAINNVIEHAYHFKRGNIDVDLNVDGEEFVVEVSNDTGATVEHVNPCSDSTPESDRGRGWQIIKAWSDRASISRSGEKTVVTLAKRICN